jgi:hypothetical protein
VLDGDGDLDLGAQGYPLGLGVADAGVQGYPDVGLSRLAERLRLEVQVFYHLFDRELNPDESLPVRAEGPSLSLS